MNILRAMIQSVTSVTTTISRAKILTYKHQKFKDAKRYQGYGFASRPVSLAGNYGCEALVLETGGDRFLLCENDTRYRPPVLAEGAVGLYTNVPKHTFVMTPNGKSFNMNSVGARYYQDDKGLISLKNLNTSIKLTVGDLKLVHNGYSFVMNNSGLTVSVGDSTLLLTPEGVTVIAPLLNLQAQNVVMSGNLVVEGATHLKGGLTHDNHNH